MHLKLILLNILELCLLFELSSQINCYKWTVYNFKNATPIYTFAAKPKIKQFDLFSNPTSIWNSEFFVRFRFSHSAKAYFVTKQKLFSPLTAPPFPLTVYFSSKSCIFDLFMNEKKTKHFNAWISVGTITINRTLNSFQKKITFWSVWLMLQYNCMFHWQITRN